MNVASANYFEMKKFIHASLAFGSGKNAFEVRHTVF